MNSALFPANDDDADPDLTRPRRGHDRRLRDVGGEILQQYEEESPAWYATRAAWTSFTDYHEGLGIYFISQVTRASCSGHRKHLAKNISKKTGRLLAPVSQRCMTVRIKHVLRVCLDAGMAINADVVYSYKLARNVKASVYMAQHAELGVALAAVDDFWDVAKNPNIKYVRPSLRKFFRTRTRTILAIQMSTALRIGETLSLRLRDWDKERGVLVARETKNGETRDVPVGPELERELTDWMRVRPKKSPSDFLIVTENGTQLDRGACTRQYQRYLAWARRRGVELPRITMHSLRHVALHALVQANPEHARKIAGHKNIQTTLIYTHTTTDDVRATHAAVDPLASVLTGMGGKCGRPRGRKLA